MLFAGLFIFVGLIFIAADRITKISIPSVLEIQASLEKAKSDVKEIEEILKTIQSHKEMIELIVQDGNTARGKIAEIEGMTEKFQSQAGNIERALQRSQEQVAQLEKKIKELDNNSLLKLRR